MVLNHLLDLRLDLRSDLALGDLLEEGTVGSSQVRTELTLPASDLVDGDGVKLRKRGVSAVNNCPKRMRTYETVDAGVDDGDLDLHRQGLVLTLLCKGHE